MLRHFRAFAYGLAAFAAVGWMAGAASAGTIIKLDLGSDAAADIEFDGTTLSTADDGDVSTTGDQNTDANFQDFLDATPDILSPTASFNLSGLSVSGSPTVVDGIIVVQGFTGGTLELYDAANNLLLSGTLTNSSLAGPIGPPATGASFTTSIATVTGGQLAPQIIPNSLSLSMSFTDINGGAGFAVGAPAPQLMPFTGDATLNIAGEVIPEPAVATLLWIGGMFGGLAAPRWLRRKSLQMAIGQGSSFLAR